MNIHIKNILATIPVDNEISLINTDIFIQDDIIVSIKDLPKDFKADTVIDGKNKLCIPGLINCHTHSYMSVFRNLADDVSFSEWLFNQVMPREDKLTDSDANIGASLAMVEMIKSGTTCFNDMQMHIMQTTKAAEDIGMRGVISRGLVGSNNDEGGKTRIAQAFEEMNMYKNSPLLTFMLGPHAPYTCDDEYLKTVAKTAIQNNLGIHIHLAESENEIETIKKQYNCTPIQLAEKCGLFDTRCIAAHCVQLTDNDIEILKAKNVSVATNPASNMKLGNGFAPIEKLIANGVNVCIGTDGAASNNSLNMFKEMNLVSLIHKGKTRQAECVSAKQIFDMATINGAKALGLENQIGSIEVGKKADLAIINLDSPSLVPNTNLISALSYSANGSEVETVIINGKIVLKNGVFTTIDTEKLFFNVKSLCKRLEIY